MFALLSGLAGFASSIVPEILNLIKDKRDKKHELEVMRATAELGLKQAEAERGTAEASAESAQLLAVQESYRAEIQAAKDSWIAAYSATVRPTITYAFFLLYTVIKIKVFIVSAASMPVPAMPWHIQDALAMAWTENDMMMFSWIVGFWFGNRTLGRAKAR